MNDQTEDLEMRSVRLQPRQYKCNLLTNAQKSLTFLEYQSLVDFIEADGGYIVSAGRDHDINVWDAVEGRHIRRLSGHSGPVTGLYLYNSEQAPFERIIVSSSEDGTIRQWSLNEGEELSRIETETLITCMGIINKVLAVTGNHKGYVEVRHMSTGDLYSTILAHMDPIDTLVVEGNYACSATFDAPSCLKVWEIMFEQTICIYRIEGSPDIEFCSLAIWKTTAILGASDGQKLHFIDFKTDERSIVDLERSVGKVQRVRVWNDWLLSCSAYKRDVVLDVHRIENYNYFGTFCCNMQQVFAIAAMEFDSSLKIVVGGSALAVLSFNFIFMQEKKIPNRIAKSDKPSLAQNKDRSHYTLKNTVDKYSEEKSTDSDSTSSEDEETCKSYKNLLPQPHSNFDKLPTKFSIIPVECGSENNTETEEIRNNVSKQLILSEMPPRFPAIPHHMQEKMTFMSEIATKRIPQVSIEPRIAIRKLEKLLDENNHSVELEKCAKSSEHFESAKAVIDNLMKKYENKDEDPLFATKEEKSEEICKEENDNGSMEEKYTNESIKENELNENTNELGTENSKKLEETPGDKVKKSDRVKRRFCLKKKQKNKTDKIKATEKHTHKKCQIM